MSQSLVVNAGEIKWDTPVIIEHSPQELIIEIGENTSVTFLELVSRGQYLSHKRILKAAPHSKVRFIRLQVLPTTSELEESLISYVEKGAMVDCFSLHFGGFSVQSTIQQIGLGAQATCNTTLLAYARNEQQMQFNFSHHYQKQKGLGEIIAKGIADDRAKLGFHGIIRMDQTASGTDSSLKQAILNISPDTKVSSTPELKIDTNDVKASHGASIVNLNDSDLFYMQSRGIPIDDLRRMLTRGFLKTAITPLSDLPEVLKKIYTFI